MATISATVTKICSGGEWRATVNASFEGEYLTAMTSSIFIPPTQWSTNHTYAVTNNSTRIFWYKQGNIIQWVDAIFGFCPGIVPPTTTTGNSIDNPIAVEFDCYGNFVILPIFIETHGKQIQIPDPIYSITAPCRCEVTSIGISQVPQYGTLISPKFETTLLHAKDFKTVTYLPNNVGQDGTDIIKYIMNTSCGTSEEAIIEIKLIPSL